MASPDRELQNKPNLVEFDLTCGSADLLRRSTRNLIPLGIIAQLVRILEGLIQAARGGTSRAIASPLSNRVFVRSWMACKFIQDLYREQASPSSRRLFFAPGVFLPWRQRQRLVLPS